MSKHTTSRCVNAFVYGFVSGMASMANAVASHTWKSLSTLLNGRAALSPEMAQRIEKAFGPKMDTLMRMQTSFEIAEAREWEGDIQVQHYVPRTKTESQPKLF